MVFGIENLGATCFVSVILQLFIACGATGLAKQLGHTCSDQNCLACAMECELDGNMVNEKGAVVKPSNIVQIIRALCRVKTHQQADPSEALSKMLDKIEKTETTRKHQTLLSAVHELFYVKMKNICTRTCGHDSIPSSEPGMSSILSVIPKESVQAAIAGYFTRDIMDGDNKLNCDDCKCKVDGAIGDLITDLPSFFLLGFRNVQYQVNRRRGGAVKITVPMRVDETVDLRDFCAPELRERYSSVKGRVAYVCVHESTGNRRNAHSGHYLCYSEDEGQWHEFNDAKVTAVSKETVLNTQPYIMAYKIETVPAAGVAAPPIPRAPDVASDKKLPGTPPRLPSSPFASSPDRKQAPTAPCSPNSVNGSKPGSSEPSRAEKKRMRRSVAESEAPSGAGSLSTDSPLPSSSTPGKIETMHTRWSVPMNPNAPVFKPQSKLVACQTESKVPSHAQTHATFVPHFASSPPVSNCGVSDGIECTGLTDGRKRNAPLPDMPPASHLKSVSEDGVKQRGGKRGRDEEQEDEGASEGKKGRFAQSDEGMDGAMLTPTAVGDACKPPLPTVGNKRPSRDYDGDSDGDEGSHKRGRRN